MSAVLTLTSSELDLSLAELAAVDGLRLGIALPFSYKGLTCQTACHLVIARQQGEIAVLLSDRHVGEASSITHSFPKVATVVYQQFLHDVDPRAIHWLEHSPPLEGQATDERFERVRLFWNADLYRFTHALHSSVHVL